MLEYRIPIEKYYADIKDKEKLKEMSIIDIEDLYYNKAGTNNV